MIRIGVDYYPEHWERSSWAKDIALMKQTGVTTVRIAEFAWGLMEPTEGHFDFGWLDDVVKMLGDAGIEIILGTPTNCAPLWLYRDYPETLSVERDGTRTATGLRGHRCMESPLFRKYAARIIGEMTRRYAKNPHVIAWQIDNELGANHCCCPVCTAKFREYLKTRHGSLEALNHAWGADVWSGEISDWEQITPPVGQLYSYNWYNPGYLLDFHRWAEQSTTGYIQFEIDELRKAVPENIPITTNACFAQHSMDFHQSYKALDVAAYDNYPETLYPDDPEAVYTTAAALDLMRGVKRKNFWIMEQLSGPFGCWSAMKPMPRPGQIEGYGLQCIAHGADMVLYWRWHAAIKGAETFCQGLIDHSGVPGRRFEEFAHFCKRLQSLDWLDGTVVKSPVAILCGATQMDAFSIQTQSEGFDYWDQLKRWQAAFGGLGVNTDIVHETADLSGYKVVVVPSHFVTNPATVKNLTAFVMNGGTVIFTPRTGVKDEDNGCILAPLPGAFAELAGCTVEEYDPIGKRDVGIDWAGENLTATVWCDVLRPTTGKVLAAYTTEFYAGKPAIVENTFCSGTVFSVGVCGKKPLLHKIAKTALDSQQVPYTEALPDGVQCNIRENADGSVKGRFLFNETAKLQSFVLEGKPITLAPCEMKIDRV